MRSMGTASKTAGLAAASVTFAQEEVRRVPGVLFKCLGALCEKQVSQ
jgi:hypothetical protein